jgi:formate dehydrogenase iron-sulfur subunit
VKQLQARGFPDVALYDPSGVGGTCVITVLALGDRPELYGLPRDPSIPPAVMLCKRPLKWLGNLAMLAGIVGTGLHYLRFGAKRVKEDA